MQSQNQDPTFVLDEQTRKEREEKGQILKHEDELQDLSNMDLSKFNQNKTDQLMNKSKELRGKAEEQISNVKSKISEKGKKLEERAGQKENEFAPKGQELKQKAQGYVNKATEKASEIKKDIKEEASSKHESKTTIEKTQVHHAERPLTEKTKHDILELTEKLTEKIQALKQVDQRSQSGATHSSQVQTENFEQTYSAPQQERLESQPSSKSQETEFEQTKEELPQSSQLEQKQPEIREQEQEKKQFQEPEENHTERTPLVDQVLGRVHSASDNLHHKVDDFKNAFKVEEPKDTERVPLIDKLTHSIHNVADRITGVFKHKVKPTIPEKEQSPKYHSSKSLPEKRPLGEHSSSFQEKDLTENQEGNEEGGFGSYLIGEEFRENFEGFSKTVESALQEGGSKSFGGKEYSLDRFEQEQKGGLSADDFRIQGADEFRKEWPSERSELKDSKSEQKPLFNEGRVSESGLQGSKDISSSTEGTSSPSASRGINILKQLEEDIKLIDRLLEKSIERGARYEPKGVNTSSSPSSKTSQGFGSLSNQNAEIGINAKENSALTRQIYQDVNANDKLLEGAILGESSRPTESFDSSATNLYGQGSKPRTELFRDITNEVAGSISQQAEKDLSSNDKLLNKSIREGKAGFRAEPEDKENIGKKGPSMAGGNISHCDGLRDLTQTL